LINTYIYVGAVGVQCLESRVLVGGASDMAGCEPKLTIPSVDIVSLSHKVYDFIRISRKSFFQYRGKVNE